MKLCLFFIASSIALLNAVPTSKKATFKCTKECLNGGECVGPDTCFCRYANFEGPQCELPVNRCSLAGATKNVESMGCTPSRCSMRCKDGYAFPPFGKTEITIYCRTDVWIQEGTDSSSSQPPSCERV